MPTCFRFVARTTGEFLHARQTPLQSLTDRVQKQGLILVWNQHSFFKGGLFVTNPQPCQRSTNECHVPNNKIDLNNENRRAGPTWYSSGSTWSSFRRFGPFFRHFIGWGEGEGIPCEWIRTVASDVTSNSVESCQQKIDDAFIGYAQAKSLR